MIYVGLDVSLNSVAICVVDDAGRIIREGTTSPAAQRRHAIIRNNMRQQHGRGGQIGADI